MVSPPKGTVVRISANAGQLPPEHQQKRSPHAIVKPAEESSFFAPMGIPNGNSTWT
jgi:hypothetical protein